LAASTAVGGEKVHDGPERSIEPPMLRNPEVIGVCERKERLLDAND